ncbi:MAG: NAD(P)-dependent oxidoreductase [Chloroflexota bacterium]|nr:NAD(P)-dependent oxidoreductase [Chloroflexota bacterium]
MTGERFLVTGALGFIGAWTVRTLVREGASVVAFDLGRDVRRMRSIMNPQELARVDVVAGDITELASLEGAVATHSISNVIHLAALQVPFCRADPPLGARVNVLGTVNVFEAVKRQARPMGPIVYTSSIGMFGAEDADPGTGRLSATASAHPLNHYGVYKLANEGNARVYWLDDQIPSVGLRPLTVYGVGRDQGMTSGPTKAIVSAVLGLPYRVPFGGPTLFQYAEDVARALIAASRSAIPGAHVFNLDGAVADGLQLVDAIAAEVPAARDLISFEPVSLPFPAEIDHDGIEALGPLPVTPFAEGVRASVEIYRGLAREGRLVAAEHGLEPSSVAKTR